METPPPGAPSDDVRLLAWQMLVAVGAGSITGAVIGGVGGRLAVFVLRLGSHPELVGAQTDDGFAIGRFTTATIFLLTVTAGLGGAVGVIYLVLRGSLRRRGGLAIWAAALGLYTGADLLKPNEFDFVALDPKAFAVAAFVLLPLIGAIAIPLAIERLLPLKPSRHARLVALLACGAIPLIRSSASSRRHCLRDAVRPPATIAHGLRSHRRQIRGAHHPPRHRHLVSRCMMDTPGNATNESAMESPANVRILLLDAHGHDRELSEEEFNQRSLSNQRLVWVDMPSGAEDRDMDRDRAFLGRLGAPDDTLDALLEAVGRPRLFEYGDVMRLEVTGLTQSVDGSLEESQPVAVLCVVGPNWLVTVHDAPVAFLDEFRERVEGGSDLGSLPAQSRS